MLRLIGALAVDPVLYEEVEADKTATGQALLVVVLSSISAGLGAFGWGNGSLRGVLFISGLALLSWVTWAYITFEIGTRLMPERETRADVGQLLRTIGFSAAPGMLRVFGSCPAPPRRLHHHGDLDARGDGRRGPAGARLPEHRACGRRLQPRLALSIGIAVAAQLLFGPTVS